MLFIDMGEHVSYLEVNLTGSNAAREIMSVNYSQLLHRRWKVEGCGLDLSEKFLFARSLLLQQRMWKVFPES